MKVETKSAYPLADLLQLLDNQNHIFCLWMPLITRIIKINLHLSKKSVFYLNLDIQFIQGTQTNYTTCKC